MTKVNPKVTPSARALEVEAEIRANGGSLTAEQWEFTEQYEYIGSGPSRTRALRRAGPDGAIVGGAGHWTVYRRRS